MNSQEFFKKFSIIERDTMSNPHGWIQWKGTDVCIDINCECGALSHFDGYSMYCIRCPSCQKAYIVGSSVRLYPISPVDEHLFDEYWCGIKEGQP